MCKWKTNRCECPVSYCTEGLEHFGSLEVEYYFSVPEKDAIPIIETVCKAVEEGLVIEDGVMYRDLFKNVSVFFFKTKSLASDKEVFRLVLPDWEGEYPYQYTSTSKFTSRAEFTFDSASIVVIAEIVDNFVGYKGKHWYLVYVLGGYITIMSAEEMVFFALSTPIFSTSSEVS